MPRGTGQGLRTFLFLERFVFVFEDYADGLLGRGLRHFHL